MDMVTVYVIVDDNGRIVDINSSVFLTDTDGWTAIDEGFGDKYIHAYRHYLPGRPCAEDGVSLWKLVDGVPVLRSEEEIAADRDSMPEQPEPSGDLEDRVKALEQEQAEIWSAQAAAIREGVNSVE